MINTKQKQFALLLGPAAAIVSYLLCITSGLSEPICFTIAITVLTAIWWVTEALPIPATSLVPFVLFPAFGILTHKEAASALGSHVILLLMGLPGINFSLCLLNL